jgi:hypothetical protein
LRAAHFDIQPPSCRSQGARSIGPVVEIDRAACFLGLEYPAGHTWHSNGNPPKTDANRCEMVGNHSAVAVEGRDPEARQRMILNQGAVIDGRFAARVGFGGRQRYFSTRAGVRRIPPEGSEAPRNGDPHPVRKRQSCATPAAGENEKPAGVVGGNEGSGLSLGGLVRGDVSVRGETL